MTKSPELRPATVRRALHRVSVLIIGTAALALFCGASSTPGRPPDATAVTAPGGSLTIVPGREFAAGSFVHKPLAPNAPLDSNSDKWVAALIRQSRIMQVNIDEYADPIYIVGPDQPTVRVKNIPEHFPGIMPVYEPIQRQWNAVPLPDNFQAGGGGDNSAIIYQPSTGRYWEFWALRKTGAKVANSAGIMVDEWASNWGGQIEDLSKSPGYWVEVPGEYGFGSSGSGIVHLGLTM